MGRAVSSCPLRRAGPMWARGGARPRAVAGTPPPRCKMKRFRVRYLGRSRERTWPRRWTWCKTATPVRRTVHGLDACCDNNTRFVSPRRLGLRWETRPASLHGVSVGSGFLCGNRRQLCDRDSAASVETAAKKDRDKAPLLRTAYAILRFSCGPGCLTGLARYWNRWRDKTGKVPKLGARPILDGKDQQGGRPLETGRGSNSCSISGVDVLPWKRYCGRSA